MERAITAIQVAAILKALVQEREKCFVAVVGTTRLLTVVLPIVAAAGQIAA
jgi:hypothetical protein